MIGACLQGYINVPQAPTDFATSTKACELQNDHKHCYELSESYDCKEMARILGDTVGRTNYDNKQNIRNSLSDITEISSKNDDIKFLLIPSDIQLVTF